MRLLAQTPRGARCGVSMEGAGPVRPARAPRRSRRGGAATPSARQRVGATCTAPPAAPRRRAAPRASARPAPSQAAAPPTGRGGRTAGGAARRAARPRGATQPGRPPAPAATSRAAVRRVGVAPHESVRLAPAVKVGAPSFAKRKVERVQRRRPIAPEAADVGGVGWSSGSGRCAQLLDQRWREPLGRVSPVGQRTVQPHGVRTAIRRRHRLGLSRRARLATPLQGRLRRDNDVLLEAQVERKPVHDDTRRR